MLLYSLIPVLSYGLAPAMNSTFLELLHLKNLSPRYNFKISEIPSRFSPEDPEYIEGLILQSWWAFLLSLLALILFTFLGCARLKYGYFGGKKLKNTEFTTYVRWTPGLILTISFLLFFVSSISLSLKNSKIDKKIDQLSLITSEYSQQVTSDMKSAYDNLITFNMQHVLDGSYFDVSVLKEPLSEAKFMAEREYYFTKDVTGLNNRRIIVSIVVVCLGLIAFFIGGLGFYLKQESLGYALAISMAVLTVMNFLAIVPYSMQRVASTDFCEQVMECVYENSLPVSGHELGFYFFDFSQRSKAKIKASESNLKDLYINIEGKLGRIQTETTSRDGIREEIINESIEELVWTNSLHSIEEALDGLKRIKNGFYIESFCKKVLVDMCGEVFESFMIAEFTVAVLAVSLAIGSFSGVLAPRIFERWRLEEEQNALAKHNLYQIRH